MREIAAKIAWSIISAIISAIVGIIARKVFAVWGVLEPFSNWLGAWLKVHVTQEQAEWSLAAFLAFGCWAVLLFFVWRRSAARQPRPEEPSQESPTTIPDMPIHDLFFHIRPDLLEKPEEKWRETVGSEVMDKFSTGQLNVWGREIDSRFNIAGALTAIPKEYWRNRVFIYHFLYEDKGVGVLDGKPMAHTYSW